MRKISIFILGILLLSFSTSKVFGYEKEIPLFKDNFTSIDTSIWNVNNPNNNIVLSNGIILSSENNRLFPFLSTKINIFPTNGDFYVKVKYQYLETTNFGVGFGFGNIIPTYGLSYYPFKDSDFVKFQVWQSLNDQSVIDTRQCISIDLCSDNRTNVRLALPDTNEHTVEINNVNGIAQVYYDDILTSSSPIVNANWRPTVFWMGHLIQLDSNNDWTDIKIIQIETGSIENIPDITKTIIIPGLGASWNMGAILSGRDEGNWQIPSFISNYDGLINSFKNAGYSDVGPNKDIFVFSYDWRRPLDVLADRLNVYLNTNAPGQKVNIVGHSMGGLVARAYANKYGTAQINKMVTVGSPNKGTVKAYGAWEGAMIFDDSWWSKVALELTTHFGIIAGESNIQTVQRIVPSLKDLLPTYEFLVFGDNAPLAITSANKNTYLDNLNSNFSNIDFLTTALYSTDIDTDSLIKVIPHTDGDLSTWIDGKPIDNPFVIADGDGTVTDNSAKGSFSKVLLGTGWHGELVTKTDNIKKIFSVFGLDQSKALVGVDDSRDRVFVAALRSPGTLEVCYTVTNKCNGDLGYYDSVNKIFLLPGYNDESLVVKIIEDETGPYKLHLGNIDDKAYWTEVSGNLRFEDQVDVYNVQSNNQILSATTIDETPPSIPTNGHPNGSFLPSNEFDFTWNISTDNSTRNVNYEFQSSMNPSNNDGVLTTGLWKSSTLPGNYIHSTGAPDGTWYWQVRAKDVAGNFSAWSEIWTVTLDHLSPSVPEIVGFYNPELPCGSITNSKFLTVDWTDSTDNYDLEGYEYYVDYPLSTGNGRGVWNPSALWFNSENYGSLNEGIHYIKVRARDRAGNFSDWSNTCEITYDSIKPAFVSKTEFTGWYRAAQSSSFKYSDTNLKSDYVDPSCVILTEGVAQTCTITPNVCDMAGNCNTDTQTSSGANIDKTAPKTPKIIANNYGQRIWVGWLPIKGATKYHIYYGTKQNELINMVETNNSYWYSNILPQGKYFVSVTAVDKAGNESLKSNIETVKVQKQWWKW